MQPNRSNLILLCAAILFLLFTACGDSNAESPAITHSSADSVPPVLEEELARGEYTPVLNQNILMKDFFPFMDSLVLHYDSLREDSLTEHLIVNANPWIIDTLAHQDYYWMMERDSFVEDNREMIVLSKGDSLLIPDPELVASLRDTFVNTELVLNIPEFRLRIVVYGDTVHSLPVRVGQFRNRFLATAGRNVDLRTHHGHGKMIRHERDPYFVNPCDGKVFTHTHRDDGKLTRMPLIPWMEPEIDGVRYGQLIHPTTNPKSLGKAYSNGCVGTRESDAWRIYYAAPVGTKVWFRYLLEVPLDNGDTLILKDIYDYGKSYPD